MLDLILCLDISSRPKELILPTWIRDLSDFRDSFNFFSIDLRLANFSISIKSITIKPAISLNLSCLAISLEASKFVLSAVSSIL